MKEKCMQTDSKRKKKRERIMGRGEVREGERESRGEARERDR